MPRERLPMRKISDVLRLHAGGLSKRRIAVSLNIGRTTVGDYINRARRAGLGWPLAEDLSDEDLERLLFPPPVAVSPDRRSLPDWPVLHRELKRPGVTLSLLWEEYRAVHRDGYGYSRFCELYRAWKGGLAPTMRQSHVAGEKMFVDYAGATLEVIDGLTGEVRAAQIFVATLGASSYTYAEATWTQALPNWIGSHSRAFAYFGGWRRKSCRTISSPASSRPVCTIPRSTAPMPAWRPITTPRSCRHGRANRGTKRKWKSASRSSSAGFWPACAIAVSSASPN